MGVQRPSRQSLRSGSSHSMLYLALLVLSMLASCAQSHDIQAMEGALDSALFRRMAELGEIHVDRRAMPVVHNPWLVAREVSSSITVSSTVTATSNRSTRATSASSVAPTITASNLPSSKNSTTPTTTNTSSTSTFSTPTAFPTAFDTSLGNNFTSSTCPTFFQNFISNATFDDCAPVSLLLQNSAAFFKAARSVSYMNKVLDNSCSPSLAICSPLMDSLANQLIQDANCGADYRRQNPIVMQAYAGLVAYEPLYNATCLQNTQTGNYCFADAITNTSNPYDVYPYYTALGLPLPSGANPTCSECLQQTMSIFAGYAQQKEQPLSRTYVACATQIDGVCGLSFANADVKVATVSGKNAASKSSLSTKIVFSTSALLLTWLLLI